jgi:hypothetical protein
MKEECVKCKLRELTKGNQSSFIKDSVLRDAVKEINKLIEYIETFQDEKNWSNDVWSIKVAAIKAKETLTKNQK